MSTDDQKWQTTIFYVFFLFFQHWKQFLFSVLYTRLTDPLGESGAVRASGQGEAPSPKKGGETTEWRFVKLARRSPVGNRPSPV